MDDLLILEKLDAANFGEDYVFEGPFTVFDIFNENKRKYNSKMFIPHINALQKKIANRDLLGEMDHPEDFNILLKRASHVIEKLEYDKEKNMVIGRIKLLDTARGKDAKALVDAKVPLHISSRASGQILENGDVQISKLYTYDLVAEGGFKEAVLNRVNESKEKEKLEKIFESLESNVGNKLEMVFESKTMKVYKFKNDTKQTNETKQTNMKDNKEQINVAALKDWSVQIVESIKEVHDRIRNLENNVTNESVNENQNSEIPALKNKIKSLEEKLNTLYNYTEGHIAEQLQTLANYTEGHIAEQLQTLANYTEGHIAESLQNLANYTEGHIAESLQNLANYTEGHIAEQLQTLANYSEQYLAENLVKLANYSEQYLAENLVKLANIEKTSKNNKTNENKTINKKNTKLFESLDTDLNQWKTSILEKLDKLSEEKDDSSTYTINENKNVVLKAKKPLIQYMPENIRHIWENLSVKRKTEILLISENYVMENENDVKLFWDEYADLSEKPKQVITPKIISENKTNNSVANVNLELIKWQLDRIK